MKDNEYASRLCCEVRNLAHDDGDVYVRGVLDVISSLDEREQLALECYYRSGNTFVGTAEILGVSRATVKSIIAKSILEPRHESKLRMISVNALLENRNRKLLGAEKRITELKVNIRRLFMELPKDSKVQLINIADCLTSIDLLGFCKIS